MAKTNFQYEKRQRELEKKRKTEEKARRKQDAKQNKESSGEGAPAVEDAAAGEAGERAHDAV